MKKIGIEKRCSENWNAMTPTEKGAFCQKCAKQVLDFSTKSANEIKLTLLELSGQSVCGRMTVQQENDLNAEFRIWLAQRKRNPQQLFIAALLIVFGLTLFSCEDERDQQQIESIQQIAQQIATHETADMKSTPLAEEVILAPPAQELVAEESYIMGAMPIEFAQAPPPVEEVKVEQEYYVLGRGSAITTLHREFLEQTTTEELDENGVPYPSEFKAFAFPNPAVENATLEIQAPEKERVEINLYDATGKHIREIYSGKLARGTFRQLIDLNDLTSGLYLVIIQSKKFKETVRIVKN